MTDFLLDCNHLSAALAKVSRLRDRIHRERIAGHRFIACIPVLGELEAAIQQSAEMEGNRRRLTQLLERVRLWPMDRETAELYGEIFNELRRKGRVLSQVDIMLAALARQYDLTILSTDQDFDTLADIPKESWV